VQQQILERGDLEGMRHLVRRGRVELDSPSPDDGVTCVALMAAAADRFFTSGGRRCCLSCSTDTPTFSASLAVYKSRSSPVGSACRRGAISLALSARSSTLRSLLAKRRR